MKNRNQNYLFNKVFGIGLPRTGTTSLHLALESFGLKSLHSNLDCWLNKNFLAIDECDAFCDTPAYAIFEELDTRYPNSKFIQTVRPVGPWLESMKWLRTYSPIMWQRSPELDSFNEAFFGSAAFDQDLYSVAYAKYEASVNKFFHNRSGDILRIDLSKELSTNKLLSFLEIDLPPSDWPKANASRKPSLLQYFAYHCERGGARMVGSYLRKINAKGSK